MGVFRDWVSQLARFLLDHYVGQLTQDTQLPSTGHLFGCTVSPPCPTTPTLHPHNPPPFSVDHRGHGSWHCPPPGVTVEVALCGSVSIITYRLSVVIVVFKVG